MNALETTIKEKDVAFERVKAELKRSQKQIQFLVTKLGCIRRNQSINGTSMTNVWQSSQRAMKPCRMKTNDQNRNNSNSKNLWIQRKSKSQVLERSLNNTKESSKKQGNEKNKSQTITVTNTSKSRTNQMQPPAKTTLDVQALSSEKMLRFNNYEDQNLQLKSNNKELFVRLCRCGLKKKYILLKDNEVQVGIISELVSQQSLKFILHFTITSEKQVENLKIDYNLSNSYLSTLDYQIGNRYIFCIQPQQQGKIIVIVNNKEPPYPKERTILYLSYDKNGVSYTTNLFLPFLIVKFFDFNRPKPYSFPERARILREVIQCKINRKMLPKPTSIRSYFQEAEETSPNKFQVDGYHRETELSVCIIFQFTPETQTLLLDNLILKQKVNERQRYLFEELVSFLEAAFKK